MLSNTAASEAGNCTISGNRSSGFYRLGYSEPVYWSVYICEKGTHNILWSVELDGKTGEPKG